MVGKGLEEVGSREDERRKVETAKRVTSPWSFATKWGREMRQGQGTILLKWEKSNMFIGKIQYRGKIVTQETETITGMMASSR